MIRTLTAVAALALLTAPLDAQVGLASSARTLVLTATRHGSVSVALPSGGSAALAGGLGNGANDFAPLPIETAWDLDPSSSSAVSLVGFFQAPEAALTGPGATIPSSAVWGRVPTGSPTTFAPFTGGAVQAGAAAAGVTRATLVLFTQPVSSAATSGRRTDQLQVRIDLTGRSELPPGAYQGTLNLLAITQ
jgi:hypothetical protein